MVYIDNLFNAKIFINLFLWNLVNYIFLQFPFYSWKKKEFSVNLIIIILNCNKVNIFYVQHETNFKNFIKINNKKYIIHRIKGADIDLYLL